MNNKKNIKFIYGDLQRSFNKENEIRLDTFGTRQDLERYGIEFEAGKCYWFWRDSEEGDPLIFSAKVKYDKDLSKWIAEIDISTIKHLSESEFAKDYTAKEIEGKQFIIPGSGLNI